MNALALLQFLMEAGAIADYFAQHDDLHRFGKVKQVDILSGGKANCVWKVETEKCTVVVKQYLEHVRANPSIKISSDRIFAEWNALQAAHKLSKNYEKWYVPEPFFMDKDEKVIVMEYLNCSNLYDLLSAGSSIKQELPWILEAIRNFVSNVRHIEIDWELLKDTPVVRHRQQERSRNLEELDTLPAEADTKSQLKEGVQQPWGHDTTIIFGDFWPASILVDLKTKRIVVIDWECCRAGCFQEDLIQIMANLFLMTFKSPFNNLECKELFIMLKEFLTPISPRVKSEFILMVKRLSIWPHWMIDDKDEVLKVALDF